MERPGHALRPRLRQIHPHGKKTCVGSEFCRFGTQNSTQLGIELEHDLFNMWSPHKVKLAVSGCPRNCSEAGIKDVGIIGVDSGWEMYIGGNGGIKTEVAEFFVKLKNRRRSARIQRRVPAAVSRRSLLPRAHRALPATGRHGAHQESRAGRPGAAQGLERSPAIFPVVRTGPLEGTPRTATAEKKNSRSFP
ncbi:hypothetical protein ACFS4T_10975 [Pseudomonas lini]